MSAVRPVGNGRSQMGSVLIGQSRAMGLTEKKCVVPLPKGTPKLAGAPLDELPARRQSGSDEVRPSARGARRSRDHHLDFTVRYSKVLPAPGGVGELESSRVHRRHVHPAGVDLDARVVHFPEMHPTAGRGGRKLRYARSSGLAQAVVGSWSWTARAGSGHSLGQIRPDGRLRGKSEAVELDLVTNDGLCRQMPAPHGSHARL